VGWSSEPVRRLSSGVERIDALLSGGVPRGRISELFGALSCGKTSLLLAVLTATTRRGEVVAYVDVTDAFHPASVAAAGVDLQRVLWVRPQSVTDGLCCAELLLQAGGFAVVVLDLGAALPRPLRAHVWPRLLRAAERSHTACLILAPHRVAGSSAVLGLHLRQRTPRWRYGLWPLFEGFDTAVVVARSKLAAPGQQVILRAVFPPFAKGGQGEFENQHANPPRSPFFKGGGSQSSTIDPRRTAESR